MTDIVDLLDLLDLAVSRSRGTAEPAEIEGAALTARRARDRRGFPGETVVIAIAGGTGSGKSSTLNAIAGVEVTSVGALRPHTDSPVAWAPRGAGDGVDALLDRLGVSERVENTTVPGVALIDLPDMDSVTEWHRHTVEELLPQVDAVLWIVDPVKYHDPVLHDDFLSPLADHHRQFVFVLNQVDKIGADAGARVDAHFSEILVADGHPDPVVFVIAAAPDVGVPLGIEALRRHLSDRVDAKLTVLSKLVADVHSAARELAASAGLWTGPGVAFDDVWSQTSESGGDSVAEAFVERVAADVGPVTAERLRRAPEPGTEVFERLRIVMEERALLGATVAQLAIACARAHEEIDRRRG